MSIAVVELLFPENSGLDRRQVPNDTAPAPVAQVHLPQVQADAPLGSRAPHLEDTHEQGRRSATRTRDQDRGPRGSGHGRRARSSWARLLAASGLVAITYANRANRDPVADLDALLNHLRDNAVVLLPLALAARLLFVSPSVTEHRF